MNELNENWMTLWIKCAECHHSYSIHGMGEKIETKPLFFSSGLSEVVYENDDDVWGYCNTNPEKVSEVP